MGLLTSTAIATVTKIIDRVVPDVNARNKAKQKLNEMEQAGDLNLLLGQLEVNKVEAAHRSIFVAGWRPGMGWVCVLGVFYNVIAAPIASVWIELPETDPSLLYPVVLGMLGLGAMRTHEKRSGVAREG